MWGNRCPCLTREARTKENHTLTSLLWSSQVARSRWKPEAGLKSADVRLTGSLHSWPTSGHWRAFPAGTDNCAHTVSSLIAYCLLPTFFKTHPFFSFSLYSSPIPNPKIFFFFFCLETSPSTISALTGIHITHYPGAASSFLSGVDKYVVLAWKRLGVITGDFTEWKHQRSLQTQTNWEQLGKISSMKRGREGVVARKTGGIRNTREIYFMESGTKPPIFIV